MGPTENGLTSELNGLNPHDHVVPCSLEIVTAVLPPPLDLLDLLPPQAAAVVARPTTSARIITRFITDSFPIRPLVLAVGKLLPARAARVAGLPRPLRGRRGRAGRHRPREASSPPSGSKPGRLRAGRIGPR